MSIPISGKKARQFLEIAVAIGNTLSKDETNEVGAQILGHDNEFLFAGYNGIPRNVSDERPERWVKPEKDYWFEHAERNAIYSAARQVLRGCKIVVSRFPCTDCARAIIQTGMVCVVTPPPNPASRWAENHKRSKEMLAEAGVQIIMLEDLPPSKDCCGGET
jgi:dCMP deaminase